jgi:preprotein translocase subunit YajC
MENLWILAAATESQGLPVEAQAKSGQSEILAEPVGKEGQAITAVDANAVPSDKGAMRTTPGYYQLIFIAVIFVVMFLMFREPKRRQKQQQKMVQSLKKNDKVRTVGGIIGTIVDIKGDEIILKVDEANNTKIRVLASAIGKTLESEG